MKKINLLAFLIFGLVAYGQGGFVSGSGIKVNNPEEYTAIQNKYQNRDLCVSGNDLGEGLGAASSAIENGFIGAFDVEVFPNESFTLAAIHANFLTIISEMVTPDKATITYYEDNNGFPGNLIGSESNIPVTISSTEVWDNPAAEVSRIEVNVTPFLFNGQSGVSTKYWIGVQVSNTGLTNSSYFEVTSGSIVGEPFAHYDPDLNTWGYVDFQDGNGPQDDAEALYLVIGDCSTLSIDNNVLSQISVFPNPAVNEITINFPSHIKLKSAIVYDMLGKITNTSFSNDKIDISSLNKGVYMLSIDTNEGVLIEKIIVK